MFTNLHRDYVEIVFYPTTLWELSCCLLSTITTFAVVILCMLSGFYKTHTGRIVAWINFADFLSAVIKVINPLVKQKNDGYCLALQMISGYGLLSSIIASALFGHALFCMLKSQSSTVSSTTMKNYVFLAVILPLADPIASYFTKFAVYSQELDTCVHRVYNDELDYSFIFQRYIPFGFVCTFSILFYLRIVVKIKSILVEASNRELLGFLAYPAIVIICWLPNLVLDIVLSFKCDVNNVIMIAIVMNGQLQGFLDSIAYGFSKKIRASIRAICCKKEKTRGAGSPEVVGNEESDVEYRTLRKDYTLATHEGSPIGSHAVASKLSG